MGDNAYACFRCRTRIWPKRGTPYENSKKPLRMWFHCALLMTQLPKSVSSQFIKRYFDISDPAAWRMCDRLRTHIAGQVVNGLIGGPGIDVQVDETLLTNVRKNSNACNLRLTVLGLTDGQTFLTLPVPDRSARTLLPLIKRHVRPGSIINTDGWRAYNKLGELGYKHITANHKAGLWVGENGANTLIIDNYWGILKQFLRRTHVQLRESRTETYLKLFRAHYENRADRQTWFWRVIGDYQPYELPHHDRPGV